MPTKSDIVYDFGAFRITPDNYGWQLHVKHMTKPTVRKGETFESKEAWRTTYPGKFIQALRSAVDSGLKSETVASIVEYLEAFDAKLETMIPDIIDQQRSLVNSLHDENNALRAKLAKLETPEEDS